MKMDFNIVQSLDEVCKQKRIAREELIMALESALLSAYRKNFGPSLNITVEVQDGIKVFATREILEEVLDDRTQIGLEAARAINPAVNLGETVKVEVTPDRFGRIAAQTARQVIIQKIREAERRMTFDEFERRRGELIVAKVQRFEKGDIYLDYNEMEVCMPIKEQIPGQRFRAGDRIKVVVLDVQRSGKGPQVIVSRGDREFLARLFEKEIPEIQEGMVVIKGLAREPGIRSKIAVKSLDQHVDPVGACVGIRGSRIQAIVGEIQGEKIDIVPFSEDIRDFVAAALAPARPTNVHYVHEDNCVHVVVPDSQYSLAIGREGQNVRLAARLTNVRIDITQASQVGQAESQESAQQGSTTAA